MICLLFATVHFVRCSGQQGSGGRGLPRRRGIWQACERPPDVPGAKHLGGDIPTWALILACRCSGRRCSCHQAGHSGTHVVCAMFGHGNLMESVGWMVISCYHINISRRLGIQISVSPSRHHIRWNTRTLTTRLQPVWRHNLNYANAISCKYFATTPENVTLARCSSLKCSGPIIKGVGGGKWEGRCCCSCILSERTESQT